MVFLSYHNVFVKGRKGIRGKSKLLRHISDVRKNDICFNLDALIYILLFPVYLPCLGYKIIKENAFEGYTNLRKIILPEGITTKNKFPLYINAFWRAFCM